MARLTLRLPEETYSRLKARQHDTGRSMNDLVVRAIDQALTEETVDTADERERVKAALGDLAVELELAIWPTAGQTTCDREKLFASLPRFQRPLSRDVIEDRGERE